MSSRAAAIACVVLPLAACAPPAPASPPALRGVHFTLNRAPGGLGAVAGPSDPSLPAVGPAPVAGATPAPTASPATPTPAPTAPPTGPGGGKGGSGGSGGNGGNGENGESGGTPPAGPVVVVDAFGRPIPGATVRFGDGTTVVSDAAGAIGRRPAFPGRRVQVEAPGFVPSSLFDVGTAGELHLRLAGGFSPTFEDRTTTLTGAIGAAPADLAAVAVMFAGDPAAASQLLYAAPDRTFTLPVYAVAPGEPNGVLFAIGGTEGGQTLRGVSAPFRPFLDPAPPVDLVAATRRIDFAVTGGPADLVLGVARLELERAGAEPVVMELANGTTGSFFTAPEGSWPGTRTRVVLAARAPGGDRDSVTTILPGGDRAEGALLDPPAVTVDVATRQIGWTAVAGAKGYRVEVRPADRTSPGWEAFATAGTAMTVPAAYWAAGGGEVLVQAIDAPGLTARTLAALDDGPRRLRLAPWTEAVTYRVATTRTSY